MRRNYLAVLLIASLCVNATPAQSEVVSADTKMSLVKTITGDISPKSVRSSGNGLVSAHNMMYRHSVTIYDANTFELIKTVSDSVQLSKFGYSKYSSLYKGAPVEGAYSPDGKYLYVTNYAMYGKGFNREGHDTCSPASKYDSSFLYRINLASYEIDNVYPVGSVPKVVETTPDNKFVLISNWCSYDLKVISVATQKTIKTIKIGRYPRGIAVSNDSKFAYVAEMGGNRIHVINLEDFSVSYIPIGSNPRAIVLSPDKSVRTGNAARSLAISSDGTALFVVNFVSDTMSKVRTSDMKVIQNLKVCNEPIGITYDSPTSRTWVACYGGAVKIFDNK